MSETDVVVIGAGPNGLSVAAHLNRAGIESRTFGHTMGAWRFNMPDRMVLKSEPYASDLSAPASGYLARDYFLHGNRQYHERVVPLTRQDFVDYGTWFARSLVPDLEENRVESLAKTTGGFELRVDTGETVRARRVVVATGIIPFAHIPVELNGFPGDLVSHTSAHSDLGAFKGRDVLVVGGGQSALETAVLLAEEGVKVKLLHRETGIFWPTANPKAPGRFDRLRRPVVRLCEGWQCWGYDRLPDLFRLLPERERIERGLGFLGPAGSWWLKDRFEGKVPTLAGHQILAAEATEGGLKLRLAGSSGEVIEKADHVIAGTGFRFDLGRLGYLDPTLRQSIRTAAGAPIVNRKLESNVPGLYFTGALAAPSLGPLMRFVAGTHFSGPRLARALKSRSMGSAAHGEGEMAEIEPEVTAAATG